MYDSSGKRHTRRRDCKRPVTAAAARVVRCALLTGAAASLALTSFAVSAQQVAAADASQNEELQEVVVTGSLIARPNAETAEAVTIISTESLKEQGITTVEQALQQITSNISGDYSAQSSVSTFTGGASFADLRGLGRSHTLVLLDGERLAENVTEGNAVDLSIIPFQAIDHIEVLREGASSEYGTDAIAGVINFITKKDYQGGTVNINWTKPQEDGGGGYNADGSFGMGNLKADGYNFMVSGSYTNTQEMTASQRSWATGFNPALGLDNINGPTGTTPGSYLDANGNDWQIGFPACKGNPHPSTYIGDCEYLYSEAVDLIPKSNIASGLASFSKALPGDNTISLQYFYTRTDTVQWIGPSEYTFNMSPTSPYFPTAAESTCFGTCSGPPDLSTTVQAGWTDPGNNRYFGDVNTQQRVLLTFAGKNAGWDYSAGFNYSVNSTTFQVLGGEPNADILAPGGTVSNLVNPFGPQSAAGQALINSSYDNGDLGTGTLSLYDLGGHASHELGDAFGAGRAAAIAVGIDARVEQDHFATTPLAATLNATTYYAPQFITGSRQSQAVYTELNVPVTKAFEFTVSDREDRYSDFGDTNNGKISLRYQPFDFLTFRGAASTGFRAPSLVDLYAPQIFGADFGTMNGPGCGAANYNAVFTQLNCASQGLAVSGGNPDLKPETSENFDLGFIVAPVTNLGITVDYYRILIKNEILALPDTTIYANPTTFASDYVLNNAGTLTTAPEKTLDCNPNQSAATCGYIIQTTQNTGSVVTSGVDLSAKYFARTFIGNFNVGLEGTLVTQYLFQEYPNGPQLNLVGWFNQGNQPAIRWQHLFTVDWTYDKYGAGISNHFLSDYTDYALTAAGNPRTVSSYSIWNGYLTWKPIAPLTATVGVRNLFNILPPFSNQTPNWQSSYNPLFSDPLLRTFYARLSYKFF
jgi:iron complex outermembrane recepter protein